MGWTTWKSTDFVQTPTGGTGTWSIDTANSLGRDSGDASQIPTLISETSGHNGNGYSDALLTGFQLADGTFYFFEVTYGLQVDSRNQLGSGSDGDGMEEFFIIPIGTPSVPEPGTLLLLAAGLFGLGMGARRGVKK